MKIKANDYFQRFEDIPPDYFDRRGIRAVILDIDNTLVVDGSLEISKTVAERIKALGLPACFLSNGKERRVKHFADLFGLSYVFRAAKPSVRGFVKAASAMGVGDPAQIAVIGDQLLTDILGGNRAGCYTIKIEPIDVSFDPLSVKAKRWLERFFR